MNLAPSAGACPAASPAAGPAAGPFKAHVSSPADQAQPGDLSIPPLTATWTSPSRCSSPPMCVAFCPSPVLFHPALVPLARLHLTLIGFCALFVYIHNVPVRVLTLPFPPSFPSAMLSSAHSARCGNDGGQASYALSARDLQLHHAPHMVLRQPCRCLKHPGLSCLQHMRCAAPTQR